MPEKTFTKTYDEVLFVYSTLKRLGAGDMENFEKRLRSQKVQYVAQLFKVVPSYSYNLYIHGPYSPKLADDLFLISEKHIKPDTDKFIPEELEDAFDKLKKFIAHLNTRMLELLTTMHWLKFKAELSEAQTLKKLSEIKSASEKEIADTQILLKDLCRQLV